MFLFNLLPNDAFNIEFGGILFLFILHGAVVLRRLFDCWTVEWRRELLFNCSCGFIRPMVEVATCGTVECSAPDIGLDN